MTMFLKFVCCEEGSYVGTKKVICQLSLPAIRCHKIKKDLVSETLVF